MIRVIRYVIYTRWMRYLIAAVVLACAVMVALSGVFAQQISQTNGTFDKLTQFTDSKTGAYKYDTFTFASGATQYQIDVTEFSPALSEADLKAASSAKVWYIQEPFNDPSVVAIQLDPDASASPTKYVTNAYTNPGQVLTSNLILGGVFLVIALLIGAAGRFLPAPMSDRRKALKQRGYGELVVGAPSKRTSGSSRQ